MYRIRIYKLTKDFYNVSCSTKKQLIEIGCIPCTANDATAFSHYDRFISIYDTVLDLALSQELLFSNIFRAIFHQSWIFPEIYCIRVLLLQTTFCGDVVWCQYNSPNCIGCTQRYSKRIGTNMIQNLRRKKHLFLGSCSRVRRVNLKQVVCKYMYVYTSIYIYIYVYIYHNN